MASKANLVVDQGTTFSTQLALQDENGDPIDLTGYTVAAKIKKWYTSSNSVAFSAAIGDSGTIVLGLTANQTGAMTAGRFVYDVEITTGGEVSRILEGIVTVTPQVT